MTPVLVGLATSSAIIGLLLVLEGLRARPRGVSTSPSTGLWTTCQRWWTRRSRTERLRLAVAVVGAIGSFLATGWLVALAAVPLLVLGLPALLADPPNRDIELLEALDRWVRSLSASLPTGKSITDAMRATAGQVPTVLQVPVRVMVARLDARWSTREALVALADDLDRPDADAVVAALVLAAERGGVGATATLERLADSIQARLRAMREVEAERAKPRVVVRQVTLISLVVVSGALLLQPQFFRPYRSPVGQVVAVCLALLYCGALVVMRRITAPRRRERILHHATARRAMRSTPGTAEAVVRRV